MSGTITLSSNVLYTYPIPSIGLKDINTSQDAVTGNESISSIVKKYKDIFSEADIHTTAGTYTKIRKNLLDQLNSILKGIKDYTFDSEGLLSLENIFDGNEAPKGANCKEGQKAYKYYLREIIGKLNSLNQAIKEAQKTITSLENLKAETPSSFNNQAHALIDYLNIQDKLAQKFINDFRTYSVVKNIIDPKIITCHLPDNAKLTPEQEENGVKETKVTSSYQVIEHDYIDLSFKFSSRLSNIASIEDLRNFQTKKRNLTRETEYIYWSEDKSRRADKYDLSAIIEIKTSEFELSNTEIPKEESSTIALFDELTLLEKLEYIVLYYKHNKESYVFPNDDNYGYPCIKPTDSNSATDDTNEIGNLELFYIGYLINRDGPINALAAFMEIKASAIKQQINLLQYRVKALKTYLNLVNKGLEEMQKSQSDGEVHEIPETTYIILKCIASNTTRSLMYLDDKKYKDPYIVIQIDGQEIPGEKDDAKKYHFTNSNTYILIKADEKGIETFLSKCNSTFEYVFSDDKKPTLINPTEGSSYNLSHKLTYSYLPSGSIEFPENGNCLFLQFNKNKIENSKTKLPKELEVSKIDISSITTNDYSGSGLAWNDTKPAKNIKADQIWPALVNGWKTCFDSCIDSLKSQLEYIQKSISSLRQKINTFDETGSNFRNKAYTIYNKTVNSIN